MSQLDLTGFSNRKPLSDILEIPKKVQSVYSLTQHVWAGESDDERRDARKKGKVRLGTLEEFLIDPVRSYLNSILGKIADNEGQGFWLQAEFGVGKSHLLASTAILALGGPDAWNRAKEREDEEKKAGPGAEIANVKADHGGGEGNKKQPRRMTHTAGRGLAAREPAGDRTGEGKDGCGHQQQPRHQVEKCRLWRIQQDNGAGSSAQQSSQSHGPRKATVLADVVAVGGNRSQLAGPQGHRIGCVGLHREHLHAHHGWKKQKRTAAGHSVEHPGQKCRHGEPEPMPVNVVQQAGDGIHLPSIVECAPDGHGLEWERKPTPRVWKYPKNLRFRHSKSPRMLSACLPIPFA